MAGSTMLARSRRRFGWALAAMAGAAGAWVATPGLPVWWGPRADAATKAEGLALFEHEWEPHDPMAKGDGLGPVFNGRSCAECHFQGGIGGGGGNKHNVKAFEALPTRPGQEIASGLIHTFAVENRFLEKGNALRKEFPVVARSSFSCGSVLTRTFDPVRTEEINSTALFGSGWIDRISAKSITHRNLQTALAKIGKELQGDFKGVPPGRYRVLPDGRVGKFGWKAQFATLEEFVAAACANEIGLGNSRKPQAKPMEVANYPETEADLADPQFSALLAFVDTLERPDESVPKDRDEADKVELGRLRFETVGCAICHTPDIGGVEKIYSDLLLHRVAARPEQGGDAYGGSSAGFIGPVPLEHPKPDEWKTPPLWGVADSAPYFHDGSCSTLESAIAQHKADAASVTEAYFALPETERQALVLFLKTLRAPKDAKPVNPKFLDVEPGKTR